MSRRAVKNIVTDQVAKPAALSDEALEHLDGIPLAASGSAETAIQRRMFLQNYTPLRIEAAAMVVLRPQMIDAILQVDFTSKDSDKAMAHAFCLFGNWCLRSRGGFTAATDMNSNLFEAFRAQGLHHYGASSEATHMAALRRIERKRRVRRGRNRLPASRPYTEQQWDSLRRAANQSGTYSNDAITLLVLSGGLGLNSHEIHQAKGSWIHIDGNKTGMTVTAKNQRRRELPIYGPDADWLRKRARANPDGYLFRPTSRDRSNSIGRMVWNLIRAHGEFEGFTVHKARHRWFLGLLTTHVPFHIACAMAGIGPDSNLASDLLAYAPQVRTYDMRYHLELTDYACTSTYLPVAEGPLS